MLNKKAYLQISFSWMFAIIIGAIILFFAIFFITKVSKTEQQTSELKTAKEIGVLLNPLETGFEESKKVSLTTPVETRIYSKCNNFTEFGKQGILVQEKIKNQWSNNNLEVTFVNKYVFSEDAEGKNFNLFSKPFEFPYKVGTLIYLTSDNYCFKNTEEEIKQELENLNSPNFYFSDCPEDSIEVCFSSGNCEIKVYYNYVQKGGESLYFETDSLMYAAIFSDKNLYECQLSRLVDRAKFLGNLYLDKTSLPSYSGCTEKSRASLNSFLSALNVYQDSRDLSNLISLYKDLEYNNKNSYCRLW